MVRVCWLLLGLGTMLAAASRPERWIVLLDEPPLARALASRELLHSAASNAPRARIRQGQAAMREAAIASGAHVTGATENLLNAVFITGSREQASALRAVPGVLGVVEMRPLKLHLNKALDLVNASAAWSALGGQANAGKGMKIAVLDTGIDNNHPAFRDPSQAIPAGYPKCRPQDCPYANSKIIAARSYVDTLALGDGTPEDSRPDDTTPRDRVGHGTAVAMIAAGKTNGGSGASITGVAPQAWLGNYKIFGSPGVNDITFTSIIVSALDDAFNDGMDVAMISLGLPAVYGARDAGSACGLSANQACDPIAMAVENAVSRGMPVVVSAGNDGDLGLKFPNLGSIASPGIAPSAITVGATTNAHTFFSTATLTAADAPATLKPAFILYTDGPPPGGPSTLPIADAGDACSALTAGSLNGAVALIPRDAGACKIETSIANAQNAGAAAVLFYRGKGDFPFRMTGLTNTGITSALIGNAAGVALKAYIASHPGASIKLDPALVEYSKSDVVSQDEIAFFSAEGPTILDLLIKPDLVAPGTGILTATQSYDPNGDLFSASGYASAQGTSYSVPFVAAAVALAKQHLPRATAAQLKSAVTNTADPSNIVDFDANNNASPARVTGMGAGKLNVGNAVQTTIVAEPASLSFGNVASKLGSMNLKLTNLGTSAVSLQLSVNQRDPDARARIALSTSAVNLAPGASSTIQVQMNGSTPQAGSYEGAVIVKGGPVDLRVPYLYLVGNNQADNIYLLGGTDWSAPAGATQPFFFKAVDKFGVPVANLAHRWGPAANVDSKQGASKNTDSYGIGYAVIDLPSEPGPFTVSVDVTGFSTINFAGTITERPVITAAGVVNAASNAIGRGIAPNSFISIYGSGLSPATRSSITSYLPISLAGVSVSFDVPGKNISVPGRLSYVSPSIVNVLVPWELRGQSTVKLKVSLGSPETIVVDIPVADYAPAFFEYNDAGTQSAAALDEAFRTVGSGNPVQRGRVLQLFVNGLGPVTNQPASGDPSPSQPLATTVAIPAVTIGGQPATVQFSGLAPGLVGLYQVNVVVPAGIGAGRQALTLDINGFPARASSVVVR